MSADHTPELYRATVLHNGQHVTVYEGADKELAERIVVCWSACAGISTEQLGAEAVLELVNAAENYRDCNDKETAREELFAALARFLKD